MTENWEVLEAARRQKEEQDTKTPLSSSPWHRLQQWWAQLPQVMKFVAAFAVGGSLAIMVVMIGIVAGLGGGKAKPQAVVAAPLTATVTPQPTLTPTATVAPSPTPLPRLVVWSPAGDCAYVRPAPNPNTKPQACVRNGTAVIDLGERKEANGFTWAYVQYPTKSGYANTGWMALGVVVWASPIPNETTGERWEPLYDNKGGKRVKFLSPFTPLVVLEDDGDWLWVQLPNLNKGYVKAKDLR